MSRIRVFPSNRLFDLHEVNPDDIHLLDISGALANLCRFTGHVRQFYSVAEHSVHVAQMLAREGAPPGLCLAGLLHDASEAYLGDVSRPLKQMACMEGYRQLERQLEIAIEAKFDLRRHLTPETRGILHEADLRMCQIEQEVLQGVWKTRVPDNAPYYWPRGWTPRRAENEFLSRAVSLASELDPRHPLVVVLEA